MEPSDAGTWHEVGACRNMPPTSVGSKHSDAAKHAGIIESPSPVPSADNSVAHFWASFERMAVELDESLVALSGAADSAAAASHLSAATELLRRVRLLIGAWSRLLPGFELRRAQRRAGELQQALVATEQARAPRTRFGFRNRGAVLGSADQSVTDSTRRPPDPDSAPGHALSHNSDTAASLTVSDRRGETIVLQAADIDGRDVTLSCLSECRVVVRAAGGAVGSLGRHQGAATVHLVAVSACSVALGAVRRSLMLERCDSCELAVACQQLRVHNSSRCRLFVHVTCGPVLEHSTDIGVAPWPTSLGPAPVVCEGEGGGGGGVNSWSSVHDFNWLSKSQHSPNWRELTAEERAGDDVWPDVRHLLLSD